MGDYHLHLHQHGPYAGEGPRPGEYPAGLIAAYVESAARRGVGELCFTEHLYRCVEAEPVLGRFWEIEKQADLAEQTARFVSEDRSLSLESYVSAVLDAKSGGLPVLLGLEVDFFPQTIDAVLDLIAPYPWDLLIGSIHWIGGWSLDHPEVVHEYMRRGVTRAYEDYFALEAELARSGSVDVLAHVDLIKVFGHRLDVPSTALYEPVVTAAAQTGTAVEVNSSGIFGLAGEAYPGPDLLKAFFAAGVPITLASDGHRPEDAGRGIEEVTELAIAAGYRSRLRFERRVGTEVPLVP